MSSTVTVAGTSYSVPNTGDSNWDVDLTNLFIALSTSTKILSISSNSFPITQDVQWGSTYGHKAAYYKSLAANPSATGQVRLGNTESIGFRNAANSADLLLSVNASNALQFNGSSILLPGVGSIVNADVNASAAIAYSKLNLAGSILNSDLAGSIAYSKLSLSGAIQSSDLAGSVAYSKLSLTGAILNADLAGSITRSKLAALAINKAMVTDGSGNDSASSVTSTELGYVSGVTSAIQTQINAQIPKSLVTAKGDLIAATASATPTNLAAGSFGQVLTVDASQTAGLKWASPATGTKNYPTNPNFESNTTTGWSLSHTTLSSLVPNQASGSWTSASGNLSLSTVSSGQLAGSYSASLASSAATTAGDMLVSDAFTIDKEDQAKVLSFKFYFSAITNPANCNWSGTSSNTFAVYIYDVTNSAWIQPSSVYGMTQSSGVGICTGAFQTTSNSTQYRLAVVSINASAGATTLYFDDFFVGPQTIVMGQFGVVGSIIATGSATPPTGYLYCDGTAVSRTQYSDLFSSIGTTYGVGDGSTTFNLPNAKGIFLKGSGSQTIGGNPYAGTLGTTQADQMQGHFHGPSTLLRDSTARHPTDDGGAYALGTGAGNTTGPVSDGTNGTPRTGTQTYPANVAVAYHICYLNTVQMANDTDTRVVSMSAYLASTTSFNSGTVFKYDTVSFDTHASYSNSTGLYTAPVSGKYRVSVVGFQNVSSTPSLYVNINNTTPNVYLTTCQVGIASGGSATFNLKAGDTIQINTDLTKSFLGGNYNTLSIERLSGPATIAASESVNARYNTAAAQSISNTTDTVIVYGTKDFDSHNQMNSSTGVYTVPIAGTYLIAGMIGMTAKAQVVGAGLQLSVWKNGSQLTYLDRKQMTSTTNDNFFAGGSTLVKCVTGDTLSLACWHSIGSSWTLWAASTSNHISITRVGN